MKKITIAVLHAPGLLDVDLKNMHPAERSDTLKDIIKIVANFVALVLIFATMFVIFLMTASIKEPQAPTTNIIEKGENTYGTYHTDFVPPRI